ncbi:endonuclease/exonuclease/phosphatase [Pyricularia oryzae 70-15]|uniref:Endonuclease/exonuclease/phosphatase n=3 Tax=Pyricularia oryzae TaxID=318829 RepID=G4N2Z1_PYRO7|nr:endonuclease/exonuclease/phosphatase [Pyricularia oryzae 70-15]EHA51750.1 endonuclease/exonuclease/phosphatase [Pyricularia oryzae 70-15]ELQ35253.1 endonuclease/exonuclease/phosphatase family protein [Pyricularia oryzae Y34]
MLPTNLIALLLAAASAVDAGALIPRQAKPLALRVTSFNIRFDAEVSRREKQEKAWSDRKPVLVKTMADIAAKPATAGAPAIFGLQEVLSNQLSDIKKGMGAGWDHIGVAREDGKSKGEFSPIIYNTKDLKVVTSATKWLTETPDKPSKAAGAGSSRIVTLAVFEHVATKKRFLHANTHLDNVSPEARIAGIKVAVTQIQDMLKAQGGKLPVSLTGDFNSVAGGDAAKALADMNFVKDVHDVATKAQRSGEELTYTAFEQGAGRGRIDFVWIGPNADAPYTVQKYEVRANFVDNLFMSDHRAVVADITMK